MITDKQPLERIWSCLRAILCDASAAQDTCSEMIIDMSMFFLESLTRERTPNHR